LIMLDMVTNLISFQLNHLKHTKKNGFHGLIGLVLIKKSIEKNKITFLNAKNANYYITSGSINPQ